MGRRHKNRSGFKRSSSAVALLFCLGVLGACSKTENISSKGLTGLNDVTQALQSRPFYTDTTGFRVSLSNLGDDNRVFSGENQNTTQLAFSSQPPGTQVKPPETEVQLPELANNNQKKGAIRPKEEELDQIITGSINKPVPGNSLVNRVQQRQAQESQVPQQPESRDKSAASAAMGAKGPASEMTGNQSPSKSTQMASLQQNIELVGCPTVEVDHTKGRYNIYPLQGPKNEENLAFEAKIGEAIRHCTLVSGGVELEMELTGRLVAGPQASAPTRLQFPIIVDIYDSSGRLVKSSSMTYEIRLDQVSPSAVVTFNIKNIVIPYEIMKDQGPGGLRAQTRFPSS